MNTTQSSPKSDEISPKEAAILITSKPILDVSVLFVKSSLKEGTQARTFNQISKERTKTALIAYGRLLTSLQMLQRGAKVRTTSPCNGRERIIVSEPDGGCEIAVTLKNWRPRE
jgi:hypothetical protein